MCIRDSFAYLTFPFDTLRDRVVLAFAENQRKTGGDSYLEIDKLESYWLSGAQARGVRLTSAPSVKSDGTKGKPTVFEVDRVAARVAAEVGCDWAPMFEPWDKCGRGRHAKHGEIAITPAAARYTGKVVWVLDDVYTTGRTMRSAVQALLALEVHAHGLAWVYIA